MMRKETLITVVCAETGIPVRSMAMATSFRWLRGAEQVGRSFPVFSRSRETTNAPACARTVASAAPVVDLPRSPTKTRSRTMLNMAEKNTRRSGSTAFPKARSTAHTV